MVKEIIQIGNPILFERSKEVDLKEMSSKRIKSVIQDLKDTVKAHSEEAAGLSAVQIGYLDRIFIFDLNADNPEEPRRKWEVVINPLVRVTSNETSIVWEGCMSISSNKQRLYGPVIRPNEVTIEYISEQGEKKELSVKGFISHLILHELDHLEGILFLKHISNPKNIWKEDDLDAYYKKNHKYPAII